MHYYNGDLKEVTGSGLTRYLYQQSQTWHTTHPDGRQTTVFSNGQTEVRGRGGTLVDGSFMLNGLKSTTILEVYLERESP